MTHFVFKEAAGCTCVYSATLSKKCMDIALLIQNNTLACKHCVISQKTGLIYIHVKFDQNFSLSNVITQIQFHHVICRKSTELG